MSYVNNGYSRRRHLTITKGSYSNQYDFTSAFTLNGVDYERISITDLKYMPEGNYQTRLQAFVRYVYSQESGLESDCPDISIGSSVYNTTLCPLP